MVMKLGMMIVKVFQTGAGEIAHRGTMIAV